MNKQETERKGSKRIKVISEMKVKFKAFIQADRNGTQFFRKPELSLQIS